MFGVHWPKIAAGPVFPGGLFSRILKIISSAAARGALAYCGPHALQPQRILLNYVDEIDFFLILFFVGTGGRRAKRTERPRRPPAQGPARGSRRRRPSGLEAAGSGHARTRAPRGRFDRAREEPVWRGARLLQL